MNKASLVFMTNFQFLSDFSDDSFQHTLSESITSRFLLSGTEVLLVLMMHLHIQVQAVQP
jgi:hypothetical protein